MSPEREVSPSPENGLRVLVGCYETSVGAGDGGIHVLELDPRGAFTHRSHTAEPGQAAYLAFSPSRDTVYAADQRKTDGRGPVAPPASVWALRLDPETDVLAPLNRQPSPGPMPGYLCLTPDESVLLSANHGGFEHVEHVRRGPDGRWASELLYDDSTVVAYPLEQDGSLGSISDVHVRTGHGEDPNSSPQAGGHAQASPHAHSVEVDPTARWAVVCDKGTDDLVTLDLRAGLRVASTFRMPAASGSRHLAFDPASDLAFLTCELSSELASLRFDARAGSFELLEIRSSVRPEFEGLNEPAAVRVHPTGRFVYMNNRGEDSLCWWSVDPDGHLERRGAVTLARSEHPGVATRSFGLDPSGRFLVAADLPANLLRSYTVDPASGELSKADTIEVQGPAFAGVVGHGPRLASRNNGRPTTSS